MVNDSCRATVRVGATVRVMIELGSGLGLGNGRVAPIPIIEITKITPKVPTRHTWQFPTGWRSGS